MREQSHAGLISFVSRYGIYILFLFMVLALSLINANFRTLNNVLNVLIQVSSYMILGIGMTFVIMTGGIDVSVGAVMVVSASVYVVLTQVYGVSEPVGLLALLGVASAMGVVNGVAIAYFRMPAFLVTLATQCAGRGIAMVLTGGISFRNLGRSFTVIGKQSFLYLPIMVWIPVLMLIAGYLLMHRTVYGRKVMAIGGNINAAHVSGIDVRVVTMSAYILLGVISGLAGIMTMSRLGSYYAAMGSGMEFMVIAGVVIGGTSLAGGEGSILGTLVGTLIIGIINNILNLFGVSAVWQDVARGVVIFAAVMFDAARSRFGRTE
ncbi:MAG: ABC transporter permease [Synergistaceae bacterium]|jgi:ribose/xylose/arabinose/galactoside ABC-type transport system permease subunit|nr:ABC transporter permease [Synergistaceae bacterium]